MRIWQEYLMNYPAAQQDFLAWGEEIKQNITKRIVDAAKVNDIAQMTALAIELSVYERIITAFRSEFRERQAQNARGG